MSSTKSIGGIKGVSLWSPTFNLTSSRAEQLQAITPEQIEAEAIEIAIHPEGCSYSESVSMVAGRAMVEHTITLITDMDVDILAQGASYGWVAFLGLYSGQSIRVGYSPYLGFERMLSLTSLTSQSGTSKIDYPLKSWLLSSLDDQILL